MIKILNLSKNFENYHRAYYQNDLLNSLNKLFNVRSYGPGFKGYNKNFTINEVIKKIKFNPDLIIISNTWEIQDPSINKFDPNPKLELHTTNIPKLFFLNKEYKKLKLKLDFIRKNNIDFVTSVLKNKCNEWEEITGVKFIWQPFGINLERFHINKEIIENRKYSFGFTGNLHSKWTSEREKIKKHIFKEKYLKFRRIHNLNHTKRFKKKYSNLRIYWGEWHEKKIILPNSSRAPSGKKYFKILSDTKIFLNTKSALGIFNPRFFELMGSKTLIMCPQDDYYGILRDEHNCIMYRDLDDFDNKLYLYSSDMNLRKKLILNAYNDVDQYEWKKIILDLFSKIKV